MATHRDIDSAVRINGGLNVMEDSTFHQGLSVAGTLGVGDGGNRIPDIVEAINAKLPLSGGSLTGDLTIGKASPRIVLAPSSNNSTNGGEVFFRDTTNGSEGFKLRQDGNADLLYIVGRTSGTDTNIVSVSRTGDLWVKGNISLDSTGTVDGVDVSGLSTSFTAHASDNTIHLSSIQKTTLTGGTGQDASSLHRHDSIYYTEAEIDSMMAGKSDTTHRHDNATPNADGFMSKEDKAKLASISANAEVNQNAFSTIKVGETNISASTKTDTFIMTAGSNITLTPSGKSVTISVNGVSLSNHDHDTRYLKLDGSNKMAASIKINKAGVSGEAEIDQTTNGMVLRTTANGIRLVPNNNTVTVVGDLVLSGGTLKTSGAYNRVHSVTVYGKGGDLQLQTESTSWENVIVFHNLFNTDWTMPPVPSGATRYYEVYVVYGDNITSSDNGASGRLRLVTTDTTPSTIGEFSLPIVGQGPNRRTGKFLGKFTTSHTGPVSFDVRIQNDSTNFNNSTLKRAIGIESIEVIAYDVF